MAGLVPAIFWAGHKRPGFKEERHDWAAEKRAGQAAPAGGSACRPKI